MPAVTIKKVSVWKPILVTYNDGSDHTIKLYGEWKMEKLFQSLLALGTLVTFTAKCWRRTIKSYS